MNRLLTFYVMLAFVLLQIAVSAATSSMPSHLVGGSAHPEDILLDAKLILKLKKDQQIQVLQISITNVSTHFIDMDSPGGQVEIYYIDNNGDYIPLYQYSDFIMSNRKIFSIKPRKTLLRNMEIEPDKMVLIKTHSFVVNCSIYDWSTKQDYNIKSNPITLN